MKVVKEDSVVTFDYVGKLKDGKVFDSTEGKKPFKVALGKKAIIPGLEDALIGRKENEEFDVDIKSDDAYGPRQEGLSQEIPMDILPKDIPKEEGVVMQLNYPDGKAVLATITKVEKDKVTVDMNHPLAGEDVSFHVKILKVEEPQNND